MRRGNVKTGWKINILKTIHKNILNIHGIQSHHTMAYRWGKSGNSGKILFSWAPKSLWTLTAATELKDTCSLEGRKAMKNLDSLLKAETHFATEVCSVKAMIFPVIIYRWPIWTIRKGECQRIKLLNCGAWEDSWESLIQQGDQTSQSERKSTYESCWLSWGIYWGPPGGKNGFFHHRRA